MARLDAKNTINGALGRCFITIDGERLEFMQAISVKAKVSKTKKEIPIMGQSGKGNKTTGWKGTGTAKFYYNTSIFGELMERYKNTGEDIYFDMQVENDDPSSGTGKQVVMLIKCNINDVVISYIDNNSEVLEDEIEFTFEDFKIPTKFEKLEGMIS